MISLLTMGAGNVIVLEKTLKSLSKICDEVIYGDLLIFREDREILLTYQKKYNLKVVNFPFDYIFKNGFSSILNKLASHATNDLVIYMNTSEIIEENYNAYDTIAANPDCNTFYFIHRTDPHRWFRCYNRHELKWSGPIHEQLAGEYRPYHKPIFMMADLEKDMYSDFKATVFNSVKEIVYFKLYMDLVDHPDQMGETDRGWWKFASDDYNHFKERLKKKGKIYQAFVKGDYMMLMEGLYSLSFQADNFKSNTAIEYQGDPQFLGKKPTT